MVVMRKNVLMILNFLIFFSVILAQTIIENPEKPVNKNSGRIIQLKELMRITDGAGDFYFKWPLSIKVALDGSIFVQEVDKLYKFDAKGKFVKDMFKKGEGPGEMIESGSFILKGNEVITHGAAKNKIVRMDMQGNLIEEFKLGKKRFSKLIAYNIYNYYFVDFRLKVLKVKRTITDIEQNLFIVNDKGEVKSTPYSFPIQALFIRRPSGGSGWQILGALQSAIENRRFLYISHTSEYLIKLLDLEKNEIVRSFKREYARVKDPYREKSTYYRSEFYNDVKKLLIFKNNLWVLTSTIQEGKGILTDVFDREGRYLDNFYLPLFNMEPTATQYPPMTIDRNFLFIFERDADENLVIVKYEIID